MNWKKYIVQEDPAPAKPPGSEYPPVATPPPPSRPVEAVATAARMPSLVTQDYKDTADDIYKRLKAQFAFESTPVGEILFRYMQPLLNMKMEPKLALVAAAAQARTIDGLDTDKILATFSGILNQLVGVVNEQISTNTVKLADLEQSRAKLRDLDAQREEIRKSISDKEIKIKNEHNQTIGAVERVQEELKEQIQMYTEALGGKK